MKKLLFAVMFMFIFLLIIAQNRPMKQGRDSGMPDFRITDHPEK